MRCDACGAPVENGKCSYCGKVFENKENNSEIRQEGQNADAVAQSKIPFWKRTWFLVLLCVFVPYIGVIPLWIMKKPSNVIARTIVTIILIIYSIAIIAESNSMVSEAQGRGLVRVERYASMGDAGSCFL